MKMKSRTASVKVPNHIPTTPKDFFYIYSLKGLTWSQDKADQSQEVIKD